MPGQLHRDHALMKLRSEYKAHQVATPGDAQMVVMVAAKRVPGAPLNEKEIVRLTYECHNALLLEGAIKKNPTGPGYVPA